MNNERKEYTFLWFIEKYSYCWHRHEKKLISPEFTIDKLQGTTWTLQLYPRGMDDKDKDHVSLFLNRSEQDSGPENISLNCELSVLEENGSTADYCDFDHVFERGTGYGCYKLLKMEEILFQRKSDLLPQDILTVCCKIWKGDGNVCNIGQSSARTRIRVEKNSFLHVVENFSKLQPNEKQTMKIRSHSKKGRFITSSLFTTAENIMIEILLSDNDRILFSCELSLLDVSGNLLKCGEIDNRYDATRKNLHTLPLSLTRDEILNKKSEYLPDDKLSLICKCTFSSGLELQTVEETVNEIPLTVIKEKSNFVPKKIECKSAEKLSTYPSGLEDIKTLYINQCLTDVEVKTETKSFPTHKIVLCARSPVFKSMMTNDMKEKNTDCIYVDDLEDDIVQQLLLFLYSDNIENLQWETATQLYYAADKYQIGKLKEVCSSFLLENLTTTNVGKLLLLADTHSDSELKKSVEDFILEHEEQIFVSKEWDEVAQTDPLLCIKTMQLIYKRKINYSSK